MPIIKPLASGLHRGANKPLKAGTKYTSPVSSTCEAISSIKIRIKGMNFES